MSGSNYEGFRLMEEVKTLWLVPNRGDEQVNELLRDGWSLLEVEVHHGKDEPGIVWVLGKRGS